MSSAGIISIIIIVLSFYGGMNFYIGKRIFQGISYLFPHISSKAYIGAYLFIASSMVTAILVPFPRIKGMMSRIGSYWMGIFVYLLLLFLVADLIISLGSIAKITPNSMPQSIRFYAGLIVVSLTAGLVSYGIYSADQIKHASYDIQMRDAVGMKIALISDLHLGAVNSEKRLPEIVRDINDLKPDIVCIAGDIFNDDYNAIAHPDEAVELIKGIKATYGVYASLGNHDGGKTLNEMIHFLEQSNIKLLNDEYSIIDDRLVLIGRLDPSPIGGFGEMKRKDIKEILSSIDADLPIVVMDHTPLKIEQYGSEIDLVLSGHTHRGQIFPFNFITSAIFTSDYGHYRKDDSSPHFIVTSGAGTWGPPMRVGTNSEIASISLR